MKQAEYIKDLAKYGLGNDHNKFIEALSEFIEHYKTTGKTNLALQLQSILKESIRNPLKNTLTLVSPQKHSFLEDNKEINEFIIEKLVSEYQFENLVCSDNTRKELEYFVEEHRKLEVLKTYQLPVTNKVLFYGPSGCGKTLASYVLSGELQKMMLVVNLGAIVSSKLGETSKNLSKIFKKAASEQSIIFLDEFDSLGKIRDYSQDHGEMKRVVNTILQLFDYMPPECILIAATNQVEMIDIALLRRFDLKVYLGLPTKKQISELINKTLKSKLFVLDDKRKLNKIIDLCVGLSFYSVQKSLIMAIKRSIFNSNEEQREIPLQIATNLWMKLIGEQKNDLNLKN